jgi:hypothetical protein
VCNRLTDLVMDSLNPFPFIFASVFSSLAASSFLMGKYHGIAMYPAAS